MSAKDISGVLKKIFSIVGYCPYKGHIFFIIYLNKNEYCTVWNYDAEQLLMSWKYKYTHRNYTLVHCTKYMVLINRIFNDLTQTNIIWPFLI